MATLKILRAVTVGSIIFGRLVTGISGVMFGGTPENMSENGNNSKVMADKAPQKRGLLKSSPIQPDIVGCDDEQTRQLRTAWEDAGKFAAAHYKWVIPTSWSRAAYQEAADLYLGTDTRKDPGYIYDGPLRRNVARQYALHFRGSSHAHPYAYATFFCDNPQQPICRYPQAAATLNELGRLYNSHYVLICHGFWRLSSLNNAILNGMLHPEFQYVIDKWVKTQAACLFHETYHWKQTVSDPPCDLVPEYYKPKAVTNLAATRNTEVAKLNAQSWTLAAIATWLQQTFDLPTPPVPINYIAEQLKELPAVRAWQFENDFQPSTDRVLANETEVIKMMQDYQTRQRTQIHHKANHA